MPTLKLHPLGTVIPARMGVPFQDLLWDHGVEFPCGGAGTCRGCRVQVLSGQVSPSADCRDAFSAEQLAQGWRLGCRAQLTSDTVVQLAQWEAPVLSDETALTCSPQEGWGIAIDLGSTTMVAQAVDRHSGRVLGVRSALNPQAQRGADLMSRIEHSRTSEGHAELVRLVRERLGGMVAELVADARRGDPALVVVVGNTAMHHLFGALDIEPLAAYPFEPVQEGELRFTAASLGWVAAGLAEVRFLPCLGGFVGSDILAGIVATRMHEREGTFVLIDLGTNGEIVVGDRRGMLCCSTAAGPAFEGARISCGMRAMSGAIASVRSAGDSLAVSVVGGGEARGLCGSGLVDAVAVGLDLGWVKTGGRLNRPDLPLAPGLAITQKDVRELQLAKGAIAAGVILLLRRLGKSVEDVDQVFLAGAFGNYIDRRSAQRVGLITFPPAKVQPSGNTALLGAKLALFAADTAFPAVRSLVQHVPLRTEAGFGDAYADAMVFPDPL